MKKVFIVAVVVIFVIVVATFLNNNKQDNQNTNMLISSSAFQNKGKIPAKYTCDGENINPPLNIEEIPENAKSIVLIMDDPDIPDFVKQTKGIEVFDHWVVFNISPDTKVIEEGIKPKGISGVNSSGENKYTGPCPPDKEHRYFFKIYALDTMLDLPEGATKGEIEKAMQEHILGQGELVGLYSR